MYRHPRGGGRLQGQLHRALFKTHAGTGSNMAELLKLLIPDETMLDLVADYRQEMLDAAAIWPDEAVCAICQPPEIGSRKL